ncbi:hypothetical protein [Photorhabdus bodei]|uniref:DUF2757 domain-containing protein n=1 Tax=Photorhabdus bodei TaxID=2029681 RepID=A0AAW6BUJ2_9GAMM|nr:hypothetical protein [Photorhabdus bodei]MDB6375312.1 hypothetical protein [Photorhabdus bodei]
MTMRRFCENCDAETLHDAIEKEERWQDKSYEDHELDPVEVIARANGDIITIFTCTECDNSVEEL